MDGLVQSQTVAYSSSLAASEGDLTQTLMFAMSLSLNRPVASPNSLSSAKLIVLMDYGSLCCGAIRALL